MAAQPILAPNGQPARASGIFATPTNQGYNRFMRPRYRSSLNRRGADVINGGEWSDVLRYSRQLFAQLGDLGGAIVMKNTYAVGDWLPVFAGEDKEWGDQARAWLTDQWYPLADTRGEAYDFATSLLVDAISMDVDGDSLAVFTETPNGFPQIQFYSAARLGNRQGDEILSGRFKGAKVRKGIIYGRRGRIAGYQILGETEEQDFTVRVQDAQLLFEPEWQEQGRGIPRVGRALLDWLDTQDIDTFIRRGVKIENAVALSHYSESGQAETSADYINEDTDAAAGTADSDIHFEDLAGGEIMYFKAGTDERLEFNSGQRPHPNTEAFLERITTRALYAVQWPYQLIDPSKIGGASVRAIQNQARTGIRKRQKTTDKRATRCIQYALSKAMRDNRIPRNSGDWWRWRFQRPPELTVDQGHDHKADLENLRAGNLTETEYIAKRGADREIVRAKRFEEVKHVVEQAQQLASETGVSINTALDLLMQRSPNPQPETGDASE